MRIAFKEWAVVVDALGAGDQCLLLRKGGIAEGANGFSVEHQRFLLFPTGFHQERESVVPGAQRRFDQMAPIPQAQTEVCLEYFAEVTESLVLELPDTMDRLRGLHVWRDEVIEKRFSWGGQRGLHALVVRVHRLAGSVRLPMLAAYGGCKSWVELESDIETGGASPVLSDERFAEEVCRFRDCVGWTGEQGGGVCVGDSKNDGAVPAGCQEKGGGCNFHD
ncbi:MAG: DUF1802 family protein [Verrucomicrobia bacterium]|nr:DUF1802 family protein [Verrucomicrobiota bacterium]